MNNLFLEGPVQTGKSTLIRKVLREAFGPDLKDVVGFTSQRITDHEGRLLGFRLAPADAALSVTANPADMDHVFKSISPNGSRVDMQVFETAGIGYLEDALAKATAGQAKLVLLDEIGGHEMKCDAFRRRLYELLDSDIPCVGVIKSQNNTKRMDPSLIKLNEELHAHISVMTGLNDFEPALQQFAEHCKL